MSKQDKPGNSQDIMHKGELICTRKDEEGNTCRRQMTRDMLFCPKCGSRVKKQVEDDQNISGESPQGNHSLQLPEKSTEDMANSLKKDSYGDENNSNGDADGIKGTGSENQSIASIPPTLSENDRSSGNVKQISENKNGGENDKMVTSDQTKYARCRFVLDDVLTRIMRKYMEQSALPPLSIERSIMNYKSFKNRLTQQEITIIQTLPTDGFKNFEISLMYKIVRNKCFSIMLIPDKPTRGWGANPLPNETTFGDNIERIRICRNEFSHMARPSLSKTEFEKLFTTFLDIGKRATEHLKTENFEESILRYKTCALDKDMEEKYLQQIEGLTKELFCTNLKSNVCVTVRMDKETQTNLETKCPMGEAGGKIQSTITFTNIKDAQKKAESLNSRKSDVNTGLIELKYAEEGCLILYLNIPTSLFQDENFLCRHIEMFIQRVDEVADLQCLTSGECNAFLSILEENWDTASEGEDSSLDESCSSLNNLILHVEVKKEAMMVDELLSQTVHDFLGNVVTKMNGTPISQGEVIAAIIGVKETEKKKVTDKGESSVLKEKKNNGRKRNKSIIGRRKKKLKVEDEGGSSVDQHTSGDSSTEIGQLETVPFKKDGKQDKDTSEDDSSDSNDSESTQVSDCGLWQSVHIDDIHPAPEGIPSVAVAEMSGKSVSALLDVTKDRSEVDMEIERDLEDRDIETMETNKEIDLTDIHIEEIAETHKHFKIGYLIKKCIQPALGNVKDPKSDETRAVDRLKIILNWMQIEEGQMTVLSGIAKHLTGILKEKEQNIGRQIRNWLTAEATKPKNLNRAGTFRNFAGQCLEAKVIPVLAGIIAFVDTNRNLDILAKSSAQDWQVAIWLQILNDPELTQLKYSLMVSPIRVQELQEVTVKTTSVDGRVFSANMPFSWIIFGQIEDVLRNSVETKKVSDSDFDVVLKASDIFQSLPMGRLLSVIEGIYIHQVLKAYIKDFVQMVHPVQSEEECILICESLIVGCKQILRGEFGRLLPSILGCHMTFILHNTRFKNFSHIVHVWPESSQKTLEFQQNQSSFYLVTEDELTLDVLALHMLVDNLEPNRDALNKIETRTTWLRQACGYRPVVERIIGHFLQDVENREYHYGDRCKKGIESVRYQWTRVVVVKLFIEHVCNTDEDEISIKRCMLFWDTLGEGADMKDLKTLKKVEVFIKHYNKDVVTQCFGKQTDCVWCETMIEGAPVRLPCSHVMCRECFHDYIQLKEYDCPDCHKKFAEDLDPDKTNKELEMKNYHDYRKRCNSFFMEVVSQLCFADGTPPSKAVINKLMSYITGQSKTNKLGRVLSKELTIFDDTIDSTPVVRSFLLQQLIQTSSDHEIQNHLSAYFTLANAVVTSSGDPHNTVELCLLVLQCIEDSLHQQYRGEEEVTIATQMMREAVPYIVCDSDVLDKIDHIARVRFSLTVVARHIHRLYGTSKKSMPDVKVRRMFEAAAKLCDECKSPWPRRYFVKQLCRCHGIDSYHTVIANSEASFLRWVCLPELQANEVKECQDRYIVIGDEYKQLREIIVTTILSENSEKLDTLLKNVQSPQNEWQCRVKLYLALHREICMNKVTDRGPQKFTEEGIDFISKDILRQGLVKDKDFAQRLLNNEVWKLKGNIIKGMELAQQNVFCLLTHYMILMSEIPGKTTLLTPLQKIALDPTSMVNSFFPTMPQDEIQEIQEALLDKTRNEIPVFYRCPNGHPYVIGDCGRPHYRDRCRDCGRTIGGECHVLTPDNVQDSGADRTKTGHILGRATHLITAPERQLNRASFAILRLLTHISMYIGANTSKQAVCQSIKPNIEEAEVGRYILEHIDLDMTSIQNILGKNRDDILLLIHHLLAKMMEEQTMAVIGEDYPADMCGLLNKKLRSKWEVEFAKKYISPVLQNMDQVLKQSNDKIQKDQRLGEDALLQILYETDTVQENQDILKLQEIPGVWRYRDLISINHLRQNLERSEEKLPVLRLFLKEEHHLRAIRFIPSIIRLQRMVIQKYGRKLDRAEATTLTIQDVKQEMEKDRKNDEFEQLLKDFTEAWICVKESLKTTVCLLDNNVLAIDQSYFRSAITDDTPISYLIPTYRDAGLCSYILLYFLLKKQNMFIEQCCYQRKLPANYLPKVHVKDISSAHLISYHPDKDLLPMVLTNCNYTFEVGQGTRIEYNFTNFERQLMDRFLFSKSIITGIAEIETITYRSESTNAVVFKTLCDKVQQERLSPAVRSQICAEIRIKPAADLLESLDKLDIAISFLKSVGSDPDSSLSDFITNTLKIDNPFSSPKAQQSSKCKHTMSLWMTIALERAKEIAKNNRKTFEAISEKFKKNLTEEQKKVTVEVINRLPIEQIDTLVELIFECIVFKVDIPMDDDEEELFSQFSFHDTLIGYMDTCPYEEDKQLDETLKEVIDLIPSEGEFGIVTCQSVEFWHLIQKNSHR